jgi:hypothetical protein
LPAYLALTTLQWSCPKKDPFSEAALSEMNDRLGKKGSIARLELHRMLWEQPLKHVAARIGIAPGKLRELCNQAAIPYPKSTYWRRKAEGQPVVAFQLPEAPPGAEDPLTFEISAVVPASFKPPSPVTVSNRLTKLHRLVAECLAHKRTSASGMESISDTERRRLRILNAIFQAWEAGGNSIEANARNLSRFNLKFSHIRISCSLREKMRREKVVRTSPFQSQFVVKPSGVLLFQIEDYTPAELCLKGEWSDTEKRPLEQAVQEIMSALWATGPALVEQHRKREEERRHYQAQQKLRWESEQQRQLDECRWSVVANLALRAELLSKVESLLDELEATAPDLDEIVGDRSLHQWIAWTRHRCIELNPRKIGCKKIFEKIANANPHRKNEDFSDI